MDERTDGRRRDPPQKSSSGLRPEELMIREQYTNIIHTLRKQLTGELYADGNDMQTYRYA